MFYKKILIFHMLAVVLVHMSTICSEVIFDTLPLIQKLEKELHCSDISLARCMHGGDNAVFLIQDKDSNTIAIAKYYTKRTMDAVKSIYERIRILDTTVPMAQTILLFEVNTIPVLLQTYVSGKHVKNLSDTDLKSIAQCMAQIHGVKATTQGNEADEFDYSSLIKDCASFPYIEFINQVYDSIDKSYLPELPICLIHGDFSCSNILFEEEKVVGILDWDHARYGYRLTDLARCQVFFSFDDQNQLIEQNKATFMNEYTKHGPLTAQELSYFYDHLKLLLIKMILETYYYVEIKKEVSKDIFIASSFNQSWQALLEKLQAIQDKK